MQYRYFGRAICVFVLVSGTLCAQDRSLSSRSTEFRRLLSQAQQGNLKAQLLVGEAYRTGEGTPRDPGESVRWYSRAANAGDPIAQAALATAYLY